MFRAATRQAIFSILERSFFGIANFSVQFYDGNSLVMNIDFIPNSSFSFSVRLAPQQSKKEFTSREAPGIQFLNPQSFFHDGMESLFTHLQSWVKRVEEEYLSPAPFPQELESIRAQLEKNWRRMRKLLTNHFLRMKQQL